jgi:hypothetical protein
MTSNMEFTDKTQQCLAEAIQLAKDYANAQGFYSFFFTHILLLIFFFSPSSPFGIRPPQ